MRPFARALARFLKREDGPTAVEYAALLALTIGLCAAAAAPLGHSAASIFSNASLNAAAGSGS
jgi:pilus assembly protein Flp/PilA